jgi:hypothetical protein
MGGSRRRLSGVGNEKALGGEVSWDGALRVLALGRGFEVAGVPDRTCGKR